MHYLSTFFSKVHFPKDASKAKCQKMYEAFSRIYEYEKIYLKVLLKPIGERADISLKS